MKRHFISILSILLVLVLGLVECDATVTAATVEKNVIDNVDHVDHVDVDHVDVDHVDVDAVDGACKTGNGNSDGDGDGDGDGDSNNKTCSEGSSKEQGMQKIQKIQKKHQEEEQQQEQQQQQKRHVFPGCRFYLAPSTVSGGGKGKDKGNGGGGDLGLFTSRALKRGQPISFPDIIIQMIDYPITSTSTSTQNSNSDSDLGLGRLIEQYSWDAQKFGGQYEGKTVASIVPGIGSLARGTTNFKNVANTIPYRPDVDEANVPRTTRPGAGSFTHYHNLTFFASRPVQAGGEIFVHFDKGAGSWYQNRTVAVDLDTDTNVNVDADVDEVTITNNGNAVQGSKKYERDVKWLNQNGICLDNIKPGQSKIKGAGRGAFATRFIPKGSTIAPIPLVVIPNRSALALAKRGKRNNSKKKTKKQDKEQQQQQQQQLLLNYCFGHKDSSILFFPTSPVVNLINHAPAVLEPTSKSVEASSGSGSSSPTANARIQWSTSSHYNAKEWPKKLSIEELKNHPPSGLLMMEYVATRDIQPKEEVLFDYGQAWIDAWTEHVESWEAPPNAKAYSPSYVMEDVAGLLRNEKEQLEHPYAPNLEISCFYQYSVYHNKRNDGIVSSSSKNTKASGEVTTVKWQMDRGTFEFKNLRPCSVMQREKMPNGQFYYTVMIKNRPGLPKNEMIPKGEMHVVNMVPRGAIRFTDKLYTTDQHLPNAFRHEIGIPDEIYPVQWKDSVKNQP